MSVKRTLFPEAFVRVFRGCGQRHRGSANVQKAMMAASLTLLIWAGGCATLESTTVPEPIPAAAAPVPVPEDIAVAYAVQPGETVQGADWGNAAPPEPAPLPENVQPGAPGAPALWPVGDPQAPIISWFGVRRSAGGGGGDFHKGIDIKGASGTPIVCAADGVVKFSGTMRGYGQLVVVDHGDGFETAYGHLCARKVEIGQSVKGGDLLGLMGATGNASCIHLHYEVRYQSKPLDPNWFLPAE